MEAVSLAWTEPKGISGFCTEGLDNPLFEPCSPCKLSQMRGYKKHGSQSGLAGQCATAGLRVILPIFSPGAAQTGCGQAILPGRGSHSGVQVRHEDRHSRYATRAELRKGSPT